MDNRLALVKLVDRCGRFEVGGQADKSLLMHEPPN